MSCFRPSPSVPSCPCGGGSAMPPCTEWPARLTPPIDCMIRAWSSIVAAKESVHWATQIEKLIYEIGYSICRKQKGWTTDCRAKIKAQMSPFLAYFSVSLLNGGCFCFCLFFWGVKMCPSCRRPLAALRAVQSAKTRSSIWEKTHESFFFRKLLCQNWRSIISSPRSSLFLFPPLALIWPAVLTETLLSDLSFI